jgi:hypothetical protein
LNRGLHYQGENIALLVVLIQCARKGLRLDRPEDLATIQEELDRAQAKQRGGKTAWQA